MIIFFKVRTLVLIQIHGFHDAGHALDAAHADTLVDVLAQGDVQLFGDLLCALDDAQA